MASNIKNIKKLQQVINRNCDFKILYTTQQFFSVQQQMPVTKYCLRKATLNYDTNKSESVEIFSTYSQLQIILYLRDLWYVYSDRELPTDNKFWEEIKIRDKITLKTYKDVIA